MPIAQPEVTASLRAAGVTAGLTPEKLLFVGQQNGGTAATGVLQQNILSDKAEDALFGADSPLAAAIRRARRRNGETQFDAIGLDDNGSGVDATGIVLFTGTATEDGTITVYVGSKKFNAYVLAVTSGDTATVIGDALVTAIAADTTALVTSVNTTGSVALTAKNAGTFGNTIGMKVEGTVGGVTAALTAMASGATDPVLTGVLDVVGNERYQGIVWQFEQDLTEVTDFLDPRFNVTNTILDGRAFVGITDTFSNLLTTGGAENSRSLSLNGDPLVDGSLHRGPSILDLPFTKVAEFAAVRALRRTDGAVLGDLVIARSATDSFGGPHMNSKPYFNTPFPDLLLPDAGTSFTDTEIEQLVDAGVWVIDTNRPGTAVIAGTVVTTYKTDSAGNPDPTFGLLNFVDTATAARELIVNNTRSQYPQYRAASGALLPNVDSANEASHAAFVSEQNANLGDLALVNVGVGSLEGAPIDFDKLFQENLTVTLNPVTGTFNTAAKLFIVTQFRNAIYDFAIAFEV